MPGGTPNTARKHKETPQDVVSIHKVNKDDNTKNKLNREVVRIGKKSIENVSEKVLTFNTLTDPEKLLNNDQINSNKSYVSNENVPDTKSISTEHNNYTEGIRGKEESGKILSNRSASHFSSTSQDDVGTSTVTVSTAAHEATGRDQLGRSSVTAISGLQASDRTINEQLLDAPQNALTATPDLSGNGEFGPFSDGNDP